MEQNKQRASWDDLDGVEDISTKVVRLPATSDVAGKDVFVKIRGLTPMDLVRAINFPMDEINRLVADQADADTFQKTVAEHVATFSVEDMVEMLEATARAGLVEPDPKSGDVKKLSRDFEFLFHEISAMTMPARAAEIRARFLEYGERGSN